MDGRSAICQTRASPGEASVLSVELGHALRRLVQVEQVYLPGAGDRVRRRRAGVYGDFEGSPRRSARLRDQQPGGVYIDGIILGHRGSREAPVPARPLQAADRRPPNVGRWRTGPARRTARHRHVLLDALRPRQRDRQGRRGDRVSTIVVPARASDSASIRPRPRRPRGRRYASAGGEVMTYRPRRRAGPALEVTEPARTTPSAPISHPATRGWPSAADILDEGYEDLHALRAGRPWAWRAIRSWQC